MMPLLFWGLLSIGLLSSAYRLLVGPSMFDRILSLDTINIMLIGALILLAHELEQSMYLDIALIFAVLAFLETIVLSKYVGGAK
jgi:multicomponent Na+:H+ antiporter subunit F